MPNRKKQPPDSKKSNHQMNSSNISPLKNDETLLVSLPIWGWQGDGKTTAILTAVHYLKSLKNELQLDSVVYASDLEKAEAKHQRTLEGIAKNTKQVIDDLSKQFIENANWVAGTDTGMSYLFKVATISGIAGFLYVPDLPGGHYQEGRDDAEGVLREADGLIILVDPKRYLSNGITARNYQSEVGGRIQFAGRNGLPIAVFITKADSISATDSEKLDDIKNELTILLKSASKDSSNVFFVSVIGEVGMVAKADGELPIEEKRKPKQMLDAWVWIIKVAFAHAMARERPSNLTLSIQSFQSKGRKIGGKPVGEIRHVADFSSIPGKIIGSIDESSNGAARLLALSEEGLIFSAPWSHDRTEKPTFAAYGELQDFTPLTSEIQIETLGGDAIIGEITDTDILWIGGLGGLLRKTQLPFKAIRWAMISGDRILALNEEGKVFSLHNTSAKWSQVDYYQALQTTEEGAFLAYIPSERLVLASEGNEECRGLTLTTDNRFGEQREIRLAPQFAGFESQMNNSIFMGKTNENRITIVVDGKSEDVGSCSSELKGIALGKVTARIAYFDGDHVLNVVQYVEGKLVRMTYPPAFEKEYPASPLWSCQDRVLILSYEAGTISLFRILGTNI